MIWPEGPKVRVLEENTATIPWVCLEGLYSYFKSETSKQLSRYFYLYVPARRRAETMMPCGHSDYLDFLLPLSILRINVHPSASFLWKHLLAMEEVKSIKIHKWRMRESRYNTSILKSSFGLRICCVIKTVLCSPDPVSTSRNLETSGKHAWSHRKNPRAGADPVNCRRWHLWELSTEGGGQWACSQRRSDGESGSPGVRTWEERTGPDPNLSSRWGG